MSELWKSPVEAFYWDGKLSIRDCHKKTLFYVTIDTREYFAVKKLREDIVPKIVELMNKYDQLHEDFQKGLTEVEKVLDESLRSGNYNPNSGKMHFVGEEDGIGGNGGSGIPIGSEPVKEVKKKRGNPLWFKGMKAPEGAGRRKGS